MTEIYLIRHGYTTSNELDMFVGQKNVDLTEIGRAQAKRTSEYLNKFDITKIYVSDLVRTSQTAEPLSKSKNLTVIKPMINSI